CFLNLSQPQRLRDAIAVYPLTPSPDRDCIVVFLDPRQDGRLLLTEGGVAVFGYVPNVEDLTIVLQFPVTEVELCSAVQNARQYAAKFAFPHLKLVQPQPSDETIVLIALPGSQSLASVACIDSTRLDGRLYATELPPYVDRRTVLEHVDLPPDAHVLVYIGHDFQPLPDGVHAHLFPAITITIIDADSLPPPFHEATQLLLQGLTWSAVSVFATWATDGVYCLVTPYSSDLFRVDQSRPWQYRQRLAEVVGSQAQDLRIFSAAPAVTDASIGGYPCRTVLIGEVADGIPLGWCVVIYGESSEPGYVSVGPGTVVQLGLAPRADDRPFLFVYVSSAGPPETFHTEASDADNHRTRPEDSSDGSAQNNPPEETNSNDPAAPEVQIPEPVATTATDRDTFEAVFLVLVPGCMRETIVLTLTAPASMPHVLVSVNERRTHAASRRFPHLIETFPQPDTSFGTFVAVPDWDCLVATVLIDARGAGGTFFATTLPARADRSLVLTLCGYDATADFCVYIRDTPWQLVDNYPVRVSNGDLMLITRPDHAVIVSAFLSDMLLSPVGWIAAELLPVPRPNAAWFVTTPQQHSFQLPSTPQRQYEREVALHMQCHVDEVHLFPAAPDIVDHSSFGVGYECNFAVARLGLGRRTDASAVTCILDLRPILCGFEQLVFPDHELDVARVIDRYLPSAPFGFGVGLFGGQETSLSLRSIDNGTVLTVEFITDEQHHSLAHSLAGYAPPSGRWPTQIGPLCILLAVADMSVTISVPLFEMMKLVLAGRKGIPLSHLHVPGNGPKAAFAAADCLAYLLAATLLDTLEEHFHGQDASFPTCPLSVPRDYTEKDMPDQVTRTQPYRIDLVQAIPPTVYQSSVETLRDLVPASSGPSDGPDWLDTDLSHLLASASVPSKWKQKFAHFVSWYAAGSPQPDHIEVFTDGSADSSQEVHSTGAPCAWAFSVWAVAPFGRFLVGWAAHTAVPPDTPFSLGEEDDTALTSELLALGWATIWTLEYGGTFQAPIFFCYDSTGAGYGVFGTQQTPNSVMLAMSKTSSLTSCPNMQEECKQTYMIGASHYGPSVFYNTHLRLRRTACKRQNPIQFPRPPSESSTLRGQPEVGLMIQGKRDLIKQQLIKQGIWLAGFQETRLPESGQLPDGDFFMLNSAATDSGSYGCALWINLSRLTVLVAHGPSAIRHEDSACTTFSSEATSTAQQWLTDIDISIARAISGMDQLTESIRRAVRIDRTAYLQGLVDNLSLKEVLQPQRLFAAVRKAFPQARSARRAALRPLPAIKGEDGSLVTDPAARNERWRAFFAEQEVERALQSLAYGKASGPDGVTAEELRIAPQASAITAFPLFLKATLAARALECSGYRSRFKLGLQAGTSSGVGVDMVALAVKAFRGIPARAVAELLQHLTQMRELPYSLGFWSSGLVSFFTFCMSTGILIQRTHGSNKFFLTFVQLRFTAHPPHSFSSRLPLFEPFLMHFNLSPDGGGNRSAVPFLVSPKTFNTGVACTGNAMCRILLQTKSQRPRMSCPLRADGVHKPLPSTNMSPYMRPDDTVH
ncbi:unnamed protein product, partial [Symbiodinium necroappetens]